MRSLFISLFVSAQLASVASFAATPKTLSLALPEEPPTLNSTKATDAASFFILGHIMEGLTRYGKDGAPIAGVAEKWKLSDKGATFTLRKDAKWSDGKPVTAKDFVFAWQKTVDPANASEYAFIMYPIKNAEAINTGKAPVNTLGAVAKDDHTLEVTFEKPCGYFLALTAFGVYSPVREDVFNQLKDKYNSEASNIVSNGPYKLTSWVHGASLALEKNPYYWNAKSIQIDKVEVPYITSDNNARFNFFKDKKIDLISLTKDDLPKATKEGYKMQNFADGTLFFLEYNFRQGRPTANANLRKAIAAVFNPQEFVSKVVGIPGTKPAQGLIPAWLQGKSGKFRQEYPVPAQKMDLAAAKKYIEEAKKELGGTIPPLVWLTGDSPVNAKEAEYFQNLLQSKLGIQLRIDKQIFKQRLAKMTAGDFDIVSAGWGPDYADPMTFADLWTSWNENNRGKYANKALDQAIHEAQSTADPKKRMDAMAKAEKIALEDMAALPTFERTVVYVASPKVTGIVRHAVGPDPDLTYASIKE